MRTREVLLDEMKWRDTEVQPADPYMILLEVLLDIRELLIPHGPHSR